MYQIGYANPLIPDSKDIIVFLCVEKMVFHNILDLQQLIRSFKATCENSFCNPNQITSLSRFDFLFVFLPIYSTIL